MLLALGAPCRGHSPSRGRVTAYSRLNDTINLYGSYASITIGYGLYIGIAAGSSPDWAA